MSRELPQLDQISVASPCHESWDRMAGDERARLCGECHKHVYNFAEMTRPEIEALVIEKEGKFCARFYRRPDGTLLTRDCPVGIASVRRRLWRAAVGIAATVAAVTAGLWWGRTVRGNLEENGGSTGIELVDNGPVSRLANWVNPQFVTGFVCFPLPQVMEQIDSPKYEDSSHANELPILDNIAIASPCSVPWENMQGDDRARFCGQCRKQVYNFAAMTRGEVEQLIQGSEGHLCGRMYRRADGTLLTSDCPVGLRALRYRLVRAACGIAATLLALVGGVVWGRGWTRATPTGISVVDEGPLTKFTNWVEPKKEFFVTGEICLPEPPTSISE